LCSSQRDSKGPVWGSMRMLALTRRLIVIVGLSIMIGVGLADSPQGSHGGLTGARMELITPNTDVRQEIKLSINQGTKLNKVIDEVNPKLIRLERIKKKNPQNYAAERLELEEKGEKALDQILTPQQSKRLTQIAWQQAGMLAVSDPELAKQL